IQYNLNWVNPFFTYTDKFALHWGGYGQPVQGSAYGESSLLDVDLNYHYYDLPVDLGSNYGYKADYKFRCTGHGHGCTAKEYFGFITETIRISKNQHKRGEQLTISAKYIHPHTPNNLSLSVG